MCQKLACSYECTQLSPVTADGQLGCCWSGAAKNVAAVNNLACVVGCAGAHTRPGEGSLHRRAGTAGLGTAKRFSPEVLPTRPSAVRERSAGPTALSALAGVGLSEVGQSGDTRELDPGVLTSPQGPSYSVPPWDQL